MPAVDQSGVLAHGLGVRTDLPIPLGLALMAAATAVVFSFVVLSAFWSTPRHQRADAGIALPAVVGNVLDASLTRRVARTLGLAFLAGTLLVAWLGAPDSSKNPAPTWLYVWFWVGLVPISVLFGPVWRWMNPLRTITAAIERGWRRPARPVPPALRYWPAAASLLAFVWLELVYIRPDAPATILKFAIGYCVVHIVASLRYGQAWYGYADGFEVYSTVLGHVSPFSRRSDGRVVLHNPLDGLAKLPRELGIVAVMCTVIGSTFFDGLTRTIWWTGLSRQTKGFGYLALGSAGLFAAILAVAFTYVAAAKWGDVVATGTPVAALRRLESSFVSSLVPISIGYTIAHYFSFFVYQGQAGFFLASDPFARGWNLLGVTGNTIDYAVLSTAAIALVQVSAIVVGHILGVTVAHDRAVGLFGPEDKKKSQFPMLLVMVLYTLTGITLLVGV